MSYRYVNKPLTNNRIVGVVGLDGIGLIGLYIRYLDGDTELTLVVIFFLPASTTGSSEDKILHYSTR